MTYFLQIMVTHLSNDVSTTRYLLQSCGSPKRRALSSNDADDDSAEIASFSKRLIIKDVVLGGSTRANGKTNTCKGNALCFCQ